MPGCEHLWLDDRGLPTGASEPRPGGALPLAGRSFDDLFALGNDRVLAVEGDGRTVELDFDDGYPFAQVFSPVDAAFVCLEPMTAPTNALVTGRCRLVEPGDSFTARFSVVVGAGG